MALVGGSLDSLHAWRNNPLLRCYHGVLHLAENGTHAKIPPNTELQMTQATERGNLNENNVFCSTIFLSI